MIFKYYFRNRVPFDINDEETVIWKIAVSVSHAELFWTS